MAPRRAASLEVLLVQEDLNVSDELLSIVPGKPVEDRDVALEDFEPVARNGFRA